MQQHALPRDNGAPVVAYQHRGLFAERIDNADDVRRHVVNVVVLDVLGLIGFSVTAHIGRDDVITGGCKRGYLIAP